MSQKIPFAVKEAAQKYHRLVLLVDPAGGGTQSLPPAYANYSNKSLVNLNIELSQQLLDIPKKERPTKVNQIVQNILGEQPGETIVLQNIELLFEPTLKVKPLQLLKSVSLNRTIVAIWPGKVSDHTLSYAEPWHPEYVSYKRDEVGAILVEVNKDN